MSVRIHIHHTTFRRHGRGLHDIDFIETEVVLDASYTLAKVGVLSVYDCNTLSNVLCVTCQGPLLLDRTMNQLLEVVTSETSYVFNVLSSVRRRISRITQFRSHALYSGVDLLDKSVDAINSCCEVDC